MKNKKIIAFFVCVMLVITALTINFDEKSNVKADPGEGEEEIISGSISEMNNYTWERLRELCNVIRDAYNLELGEIPKGRAWATEGERYSIDHILKPALENYTEDYQELLIGYIDDDRYRDRKYSTKIVINDYDLTVNDGSYPYQQPSPYSEYFPAGVAINTIMGVQLYDLNNTFTFSNVNVVPTDLHKLPFGNMLYNEKYYNVTCEPLNDYDVVFGHPVRIENDDSIPEDQLGYVFILDEEPDCEDKLDDITDAMGCILIENVSKAYSYQNATQMNFSIIKVSPYASNLSIIIDDLVDNETDYIVENFPDNHTFTFTYDLGNSTCWPNTDWIALVNRTAPSDPLSYDILFEWLLKLARRICSYLGLNTDWLDEINDKVEFKGAYYDFTRLITYHMYLFYTRYILDLLPYSVGFILSDFGDTHFMTHTTKDWHWFSDGFSDRFYFPMFSVNKSVGDYLYYNYDDLTVSGFVEQEYKVQTPESPGVVSYNAVGYRNITKSPDDGIVILSNRIDGWWGETPGDSGTGAAILLGIIKYFDEYDITPKYNLTFLFTTGGEYGMRGAQHYNDSHPDDNIITYIGLDQLGFSYTESDDKINLTIQVLNNNTKGIINAIVNDIDYEGRTGYGCWIGIPDSYGSEDKVFSTREGTNTIGFGKDNSSRWDGYHRTGSNFSKGDSLNHIDRNDVNVTLELYWEVVKYCSINPNCWFDSVTYTPFDSPNDGDTLDDSINVSFTLNSSLPHDKVMVKTYLKKYSYDKVGVTTTLYSTQNYTVTDANVQDWFIFTIPDDESTRDYAFELKLYNSTGRINDAVGIGGSGNIDDTSTSSIFTLYHPFGYTKAGESPQSVYNQITGSTFTCNEYGTADNITMRVPAEFQNPPGAPKYKCMIYRANDSSLIGTTEELDLSEKAIPKQWVTLNFTTKPNLIKDTEYILVAWGSNSAAKIYYDSYEDERGRYNDTAYGSPPSAPFFSNESRLYSIYCGYTPDANPPEIKNVASTPVNTSYYNTSYSFYTNITADVTDDISGVDTVKVAIYYPNSTLYGNYTMNLADSSTYWYNWSSTNEPHGTYNFTIWAVDNTNNSNTSAVSNFTVSICGDANGDGVVNVSDGVFLINYVMIPGSPAPDPLCSGDANGDGVINVSDAVYVNNWVLQPGSPPPVNDCCPCPTC